MAEKRPHVIVLGSGFGAFSFLKKIDTERYDVTVVSPRNYFLFTPLLPSTTVGTIEFRSIIEPVRTAREQVQYFQASCQSIDAGHNAVECERALDGKSFRLEYDYLVIAVGAISNTFGIPGVKEHTHFLRELSEARTIRQGIIDCFERAGAPGLPDDERRRLLHFVVVGGGPTGVEFAAELHDFVTEDLRKWFPRLMEDVRITLVEAAPGILTTFDKKLSEYALRIFQRQRIEVRTQAMVREVRAAELVLSDGSSIPFGFAVWSTGNGPTPFVQGLPFEKDRRSRLVTDEYLHVMGTDNIYALGDCATIRDRELPATAQVAQQMGRYLSETLNRKAKGKPVGPFSFHNMGMLAYIGSRRALADLPNIKGRGFSTWLFWRSAYLTKLVSFKNKILVVFDWVKTSIFGRDISRF